MTNMAEPYERVENVRVENRWLKPCGTGPKNERGLVAEPPFQQYPIHRSGTKPEHINQPPRENQNHLTYLSANWMPRVNKN
jgi:hypothetical protein